MPLPRRHFLACAAAFAARPALAETGPVIAAAASLRFVMDDLVSAFDGTVRVAFGSSGTLAQQIRNGAPFEIFLSADESYVQALAADGFLADDGAVYARGRLALIVPKAGDMAADATLDDLAARLAAGRLRRFAIANPEHAPYGIRAREALVHRGLWQAMQPVLVFGENVAQAAQFAVSGNAQGGLVAASLASAGPVAARARAALIAEDWHSPLRQRMALTPAAGPVAEAFFGFLHSEAARAIFARHGFAAPGPG
ncbi:MAG: molybdate ABC transporter substrate-binding protein [Rhodobacteraceae bacterium]|nr:MAG: molybdate ABC transporter substrate-binding protein [Paracoccaceae bacterium]